MCHYDIHQTEDGTEQHCHTVRPERIGRNDERRQRFTPKCPSKPCRTNNLEMESSLTARLICRLSPGFHPADAEPLSKPPVFGSCGMRQGENGSTLPPYQGVKYSHRIDSPQCEKFNLNKFSVYIYGLAPFQECLVHLRSIYLLWSIT